MAPLDLVAWQFYLLACFALALVLCIKGLVSVARPGWTSPKTADLATTLAVLLLTTLLACEAWASNIQSLFIGCGTTLLIAPQSWLTVRLYRQSPSPSRFARWLAVASCLATALWTSERLYEGHLKLEAERINSLVRLGELAPIADFVGVTDQGREVKLFRWVNYQTVGLQCTPASDEESFANCHGWVFTEGGYLLQDPDVEQILNDNGYIPSPNPQQGDLIVYRDQDGAITHTGVVQVAVLGRSLIASKWGMEKCFVHPPRVQPYGNRYTFYRSARQGHSLTIRAAAPKYAQVTRD